MIFPYSLVITVSVLMSECLLSSLSSSSFSSSWTAAGLSLFVARIPALYYAYPQMKTSTAALANYDNALLVLILSVVPIWLLATYWSVSYM